jgi:hypothetical protein
VLNPDGSVSLRISLSKPPPSPTDPAPAPTPLDFTDLAAGMFTVAHRTRGDALGWTSVPVTDADPGAAAGDSASIELTVDWTGIALDDTSIVRIAVTQPAQSPLCDVEGCTLLPLSWARTYALRFQNATPTLVSNEQGTTP